MKTHADSCCLCTAGSKVYRRIFVQVHGGRSEANLTFSRLQQAHPAHRGTNLLPCRTAGRHYRGCPHTDSPGGHWRCQHTQLRSVAGRHPPR